MPTETEKKEVKKENFATVEEALEGAGTTVLSHLGSDAKKISVEELEKVKEELHLTGPKAIGEYRAYAGPYTDLDDPRNGWTYVQDVAAEMSPTRAALEAEEEAPEEEGEASPDGRKPWGPPSPPTKGGYEKPAPERK